MSSRRVLSAMLAVAAAATLAGCAPTVNMTPAPEFANDPACADVIVRLPDTVSDYPKRQTDAQSTAAWGDPTAMLLSCGVPVPGPSELPCIDVDGTFWLREEVDAGFAFTTFGRDPAVRVVVDGETIPAGVALHEIALAVSVLPTNGHECTDLEDTVTGE
jgi:hypothetical protein